MIFDGPTFFLKHQTNCRNLRRNVRHQMREAEPRPRSGRGGGKPPPGLGGLEGSDSKGEKFGGSEEKKGLYMQTWWVGGFSTRFLRRWGQAVPRCGSHIASFSSDGCAAGGWDRANASLGRFCSPIRRMRHDAIVSPRANTSNISHRS